MPLYAFMCEDCEKKSDHILPAERRDQMLVCACGGVLKRRFTPAWNAAIPGQHNRVNRHWRETGKPLDVEYADVLSPTSEG